MMCAHVWSDLYVLARLDLDSGLRYIDVFIRVNIFVVLFKDVAYLFDKFPKDLSNF